MPQPNNSAKEQLLKLEKLIKKVIRKSLKNNTLDYTVQITVSSLQPGKIQYAAQITSPAQGVQPITYIFDTFDMLKTALEESEKELNPQKVEIAFHENRINSYKNKIEQHEARKAQLEDPNYDSGVEAIPLEEVEVEDEQAD